MSADVPKMFEHFWSYLEDNTDFSVLWFLYNTKKDTKSSCVKELFVRICDNLVPRSPTASVKQSEQSEIWVQD